MFIGAADSICSEAGASATTYCAASDSRHSGVKLWRSASARNAGVTRVETAIILDGIEVICCTLLQV